MFNSVSIRNNDIYCTVRYWPKHTFDHEPPRPEKKEWYYTPFTDENGDFLKGYLMPSEKELEFKKAESLRCSISRSKKRIREIATSRTDWKYFFTFTFSSGYVDRYDYSACAKVMSDTLNSLMVKYPTMAYCVVPEKHKDGAIHFHGIFTKELPVVFAGNFRKTGETYHCKAFHHGFTCGNIVCDQDRIASYITKYITKDLIAVAKGKKRYWHSKSTIILPDKIKGILSMDDFINYCIDEEENIISVSACNGERPYEKFYEIKLKVESYETIINYMSGYDDGDSYYTL